MLFIISSVAGGGKTTLINMLLEKHPFLKYSISYTTRSIRSGDIPNESYYFIKVEEFLEKVRQNYFFEWALVHSNYYGTPRKELLDAIKSGKQVILDIDIQGAQIVKKEVPDACTIFILPPNEDVWIDRLTKRGTESTETLLTRIQNGKKEIKLAKEFEYNIINDDLNKSFNQLETIILSKVNVLK